jgi:hypothetical protein
MKGQPFKRLAALLSAVALFSNLEKPNKKLVASAKANLYNYRSRGKGKGLHQKANVHAHMNAVRAARKARNKRR